MKTTNTQLKAGKLYAWGANHSGQLGFIPSDDILEPREVIGLPPVVSVVAGGSCAFALDEQGGVWSWGWSVYGELGIGEVENDAPIMLPRVLRDMGHETEDPMFGDMKLPTRIDTLPPIKQVARSDSNVFALDEEGNVWAWGQEMGLGRKAKEDANRPVKIDTLKRINRLFTSSEAHAIYATDEDGRFWAWGNGWEGEMGHGKPRYVTVPEPVDTLQDVKTMCAIAFAALALKQDGSLWGWGSSACEFGIEPKRGRRINEPLLAEWIDPMNELLCGDVVVIRNEQGESFAWGSGYASVFATDIDATKPVRVAELDEMTAFAIGSNHALAINHEGKLFSAGLAESGVLARSGLNLNQYSPLSEVPGLDNVLAVSVAMYQSFAIVA